MGAKKGGSGVNVVLKWLKRQSMKVKSFLAVTFVVCSLMAMKLWVKNHEFFFIASEATHAAGIIVLIYKLTTKKTCSGLSLRSQELTALFLAVRLICSTVMEGDIHTLLDFATLVSTAWVIYMIRFKLKSTYIKKLDNFPLYYIVVPCAILALIIHPYRYAIRVSGVLWAFCVYLESVSVLPQLRMMQNAKMIEPFTSHYVFALGAARFLSCAHWILQVIETRGRYLYLIGYGYLWFPTAFFAEMVQTFILADFCYYYMKSLNDGQLIMKMPV
ncbi:ER lumen protein-retaining receptor erd-2.2-like isoform X1 [Mangifera indica]|uniref:ER lumen protein-retaining receptor erd-2.2-like isoform X1 n=1 Tax=Mangifera indica TaxID=29780 RepID=UPI001CFB4213|nr:ER lumen protein-retaining receptor erd-2.2-like isoform X1 [Mangifera indica]